MGKILGIDLGTNSIGMTVRDDSYSDIREQIRFSSVCLFKSGVGNGKTGEFSFAAERTKFRSQRKLYKVRRYRKWATLKLLIDEGLCPLSKDDLKRWTTYDKRLGLKREYPVDAKEFQQWIKLDFNGDGKPDYSTPYELRAELATDFNIDFTKEVNKYKLGRVIYHIAERRGFRSSKGETLKEQEERENEVDNNEAVEISLKKSEEKISGRLTSYMNEHNLHTVGEAFHRLISIDKIRVRASEYQAVRQQFKDELRYIFENQKQLSTDSSLFHRLTSERKADGTVFYKRPLKSQKGLVGRCMLEPSKSRCPQSRPEYESFRAWQMINNIRFGEGCQQQLSLEQKKELFENVFVRIGDCTFQVVREYIEKHFYASQLKYSRDKSRTINYDDSVNVSACTITKRFVDLLGDNWQNWKYTTEKKRKTGKNGNNDETHIITYTWEDVWHICFSADDEEPLERLAESANLDTTLLRRLWLSMTVTYANLSLKAISNINRFLQKGLLYNEACLLAKLPDLMKEQYTQSIEDSLMASIGSLFADDRQDRHIRNIVNSLIADYNAEQLNKRDERSVDYKLDDDDYQKIENKIIGHYGEATWKNKNEEERELINNAVADLYQDFFSQPIGQRKYVEGANIQHRLKEFLFSEYELTEKQLNCLYHHSDIEAYRPAPELQVTDGDRVLSLRLLESPVLNSLRNPMALRVLHTLRRKVNDLLKAGIIDEDTRIVIEVTRNLNDANMRWAIRHYQENREKENEEFKKQFSEYFQVRMLAEQHQTALPSDYERANQKPEANKKEKEEFVFDKYMKNLLDKYRLWVQQGGFCIYTGKPINIKSLGEFDIEHTIPRSISFDDSETNQTLCDSYFNRQIKKNRMPCQLDNYEEILQRIQPWFDKVERLEKNVEFWKKKSKDAQTKDAKDRAIRQKHLWKMELDYWRKKVSAFTVKEYKESWRNNQLADTSTIAKYATLYMKSAFHRVEVQKGSTTASFRKILGIQDVDEKKKRDNHTHHAIDAYTLTLVPVAAMREQILKLWNEITENESMHHDASDKRAELRKLLMQCRLDTNFNPAVNSIKENALAVYEQKNQVLAPASRRMRVRGKIVPLRDANGKIMFEKNEDGTFRLDANRHKIPIAKRWIKGDCIRGNLHGDTIYGAVKDSDGTVIYVTRRELKYKKNANESGFKTWEELEKSLVNPSLVKVMKKQFPEGTSFQEAMEQGVFMLNKKGEKINKIRHVRCKTRVNNPIPLKKHAYPSKHKQDYKSNVYVANGENTVYAKYEGDGKTAFSCLSLFKVSQIMQTEGVHDLRSLFPETITEKKKELKLSFVVVPGTMVVLRKDSESDIREVDTEQLRKRLYCVKGVESDGRLKLQYHTEARPDNELTDVYGKLGSIGFSDIDYSNPHPRLRLTQGKQNFWIEGIDFNIVNGVIVPK
ncbi:MAG: hypothetical protein IKR18_10410 [Bacteroidaceae bacterium]|nr:hypothetical protein [Bacteroidaceae bacterium]